jgi:hypothetical protein
LCWTRRQGFSGPLALEYQEVEAWCRLTRRTLGQLELKLLMVMDMAYVHAINEKHEREKKGVDDPNIIDEVVEEQGLTPELFDALFIAGSNDNILRKNADA